MYRADSVQAAASSTMRQSTLSVYNAGEDREADKVEKMISAEFMRELRTACESNCWSCRITLWISLCRLFAFVVSVPSSMWKTESTAFPKLGGSCPSDERKRLRSTSARCFISPGRVSSSNPAFKLVYPSTTACIHEYR